MEKYIVSLDQSTTSSSALIFNQQKQVIGLSRRELNQIYPKPGWVEHNPMEIWATQSACLTEVLAKNNILPEQIQAIGITNQRETTVIWDKNTGEPIHNAIVWQCRRTEAICKKLRQQGLGNYVQKQTGLVIDAYFSATKIRWILDHVEGAQEKARSGQLLFGTIDSWLIWKLTNGKVHTTDLTNASRTMLFNINNLCWDPKLLAALNLPKTLLPEVASSSEIYGYTNLGGKNIPISGIAGDQQAALVGQQCLQQGMAKNTYGTGCFLLMNTGEKPVRSKTGLLTTIAYGIDNRVHYALEGSVFIAGASIQWLRDELGLIRDASDTQYFASKVENTNGVYLVPAFTGLGAPYWDANARGALVGLSRGTNRNHIIRAALEAIAYQSRDVLEAMQKDAKLELKQLQVDGGAAVNDFLMQFQADMIQAPVIRSKQLESTATGAAYLAGLAINFWDSTNKVGQKSLNSATFLPKINESEAKGLYQNWQKAINCARQWQAQD